MINTLSEKAIGAAIEVHKGLGPGLLESAYEECLAYELGLQGLKVVRQRHLPLKYKEIELEVGYRLDLVVENQLILEIKTVEQIMPIHEAQLLTYLRLSGLKLGLLLNFHTPVLIQGIRRFIN